MKNLILVNCTRSLILIFVISIILPLLVYAQDTEQENRDYQQLCEEFDSFWENREYERGKGFKPFRRIQNFTMTREDAFGQFNPYALLEGLQERNRLFDSGLDEADWTPMGPFTPQEDSYVGGMGRVNAFAFHPNEPDTWYCGAAMGGLWKTVDAGLTWEPLTDNLMALGVTSIIVHPQHPDTIYIATGDRDGFRRRVSSYSIGVWRTTDGGTTWEPLDLEFPYEQQEIIGRMVMHPSNPDIIMAGTLNGVYRTVNGGDDWIAVYPFGQIYDLDVNPDNGDVWFAAWAEEGLYRTTDGGDNWTELTSGLPTGGFTRIDVAIAPSNPQTIYALYADDIAPFYTGLLGIYKSEDGGDSWELITSTPNLLGWEPDGSDTGGQGWFAVCMAVHPEDEDHIFVGSVNMWETTNGGASWENIGYWYPTGNLPYVHADHHVLQFHGNVLFNGNDGGVYYWDAENEEWIDRSNMLVITQVYRLGTFAGSEDVTYIMNGNQDNGSKLYNTNQEWIPVIGGDGMDCGVDPINSNYMYGSIYYGQMYRSTDGGHNWGNMNDGIAEDGAWTAPFVIDPNNGNLFRANRRVYFSNNHGSYWNSISPMLTQEFLHSLAVAPSDNDVIYTADYSYNMYMTTDGGENWNLRLAPSDKVTSFAVHPQDPSIVYATSGRFIDGEKVFRSDDYAQSWTNISEGLPNIPINTVVIHPLDPNHVYIGTDIGVFLSTDAGTTWEDYSTGLPNVIVQELEIHVNSNTLLAATFGRGTWQSPAEPVTDVPDGGIVIPDQYAIASLFPNPFNSMTTIAVNLPQTNMLNLRVYNVEGREISTLANGQFTEGLHQFRFAADGYASGVYFIRVIVPGQMDEERKIILLR